MSIVIAEELSAVHLIRLRQCLDAVEYPATHTELLVAASHTCGDPEILSRLAAIPDREYAGSFYVMQAIKLSTHAASSDAADLSSTRSSMGL
jgi:hypothetical protein